MIKRKQKKNNQIGDVLFDMTPMIDVTFFLLVFFILTTGTANVVQRVYPVDLPNADKSYKEREQIKKNKVTVTIFKDGSFSVNDTKVPTLNMAKNLILEMFTNNTDIYVFIVPDAGSASELLLSLLTFCKGHNINKVDILIEDGNK